MSVIVDGSNGLVFNDASTQTTAATGFGFKNRIINGDMRIDQRNAGAAVTVNSTSDFFPVDRFAGYGQVSDGVYTLQQSSVAPAGFVNSILATVTTADASVGASQYYFLQQKIEGFNVADLGFGTANAKSVTLSFWVRSSLTGTFGGSIANGSFNRAYPFTYTINSANTWEQKSITIAGDTSGTWLTTNGIGLRVYWDFGSGSDNVAAAGSWVGAGEVGATGGTKLISTSGATFYITGVQLEVGSTATNFDYRSFGHELQLCYRYCFLISGLSSFSTVYSRYLMFGNSTTSSLWLPTFPVQMRIPPTLLTKNFNGSYVDFYNYNTTVTLAFSSVAIAEGDVMHAQVGVSFSSGVAVGNMISWRWINNPDAYIGFSAEL